MIRDDMLSVDDVMTAVEDAAGENGVKTSDLEDVLQEFGLKDRVMNSVFLQGVTGDMEDGEFVFYLRDVRKAVRGRGVLD